MNNRLYRVNIQKQGQQYGGGRTLLYKKEIQSILNSLVNFAVRFTRNLWNQLVKLRDCELRIFHEHFFSREHFSNFFIDSKLN